jgi:inhibitor of KinA sporulation pathway (predicted exonuclease)
MKHQNYLALDLELNNKNDGSRPKIIEVGIAIGSPVRSEEEILTHNWYLDPQEPIHPDILQLTGISDQIIAEKAVSHETLAQELGTLIDKYNCFVNPVTWGQGDAQELRQEIREKGIDFPYFGRRIFDVKTLHCFERFVEGKCPAGGLRRSMASHKFPFVGTPHRAKDDAHNTLRFFFHFLQKETRRQTLIKEIKNL